MEAMSSKVKPTFQMWEALRSNNSDFNIQVRSKIHNFLSKSKG